MAVTNKIEVPLAESEALELIEDVAEFRGWNVLNFDAKTVVSAVRINNEYGIPYWDALIAATMRGWEVYRIYTENEKDFRKIPWLNVLNPLK